MTELDKVETVKLAAKIDAMHITLEDMDVKVERMDEAIRGNGKPGMVTQVALLHSRVKTTEAFVADFKILRRWMSMGILALFGSLAWDVIERYMST